MSLSPRSTRSVSREIYRLQSAFFFLATFEANTRGQTAPSPPMTLGNMRELGVRRLIASCLNDECRHTALIEVSSYPAETEVPSFQSRAICGKCGGKRVDVRPNWKEQTTRESLTGKLWR